MTPSTTRSGGCSGKTDPLPAWERYAEALSVRLTPSEFEAVTQSVSELARFSEHIRDTPIDPSGAYWTLSPEAVSRLKEMREHATAAFNALAKSAKDPEGVEPGKLLHEEQEPT